MKDLPRILCSEAWRYRGPVIAGSCRPTNTMGVFHHSSFYRCTATSPSAAMSGELGSRGSGALERSQKPKPKRYDKGK